MTDRRPYERISRRTVNGLHPPTVKVLDMIRGYVAEHAVMPTIDQITAAVGGTRHDLMHRLGILEARGWIRRAGNRYGRYELTDQPWVEPVDELDRTELLDDVVAERFGLDARRAS